MCERDSSQWRTNTRHCNVLKLEYHFPQSWLEPIHRWVERRMGGEEMSCNGFGSGPLSKIAHGWGVIEKESWEKACLAWTYTKSSCSPSFSFCSSYQRETEGKKVMHQLLNWYHGGILSLGLWVSYKNHTDTDSSLASSSFELLHAFHLVKTIVIAYFPASPICLNLVV